MNEKIMIEVYRSSNDNYFYWSIWKDKDFLEEDIESGICTSKDIKVAIEQATDKAKELYE